MPETTAIGTDEPSVTGDHFGAARAAAKSAFAEGSLLLLALEAVKAGAALAPNNE